MKMKKAVFGSKGNSINMMRGFTCRSEAATAVLCRSMTTTGSHPAVILPRGRVLHPPPTRRRHHQQLSALFVANNEKYMRSAFYDYSSSSAPSSSAATATSRKTLLFTGGCGGGGGSASLAVAPMAIRKARDREKGVKPPAAAASALSSSKDTHVFKWQQVVVMRVSLHCEGCARKVKKHLSKMEGVTSFSIDLELKKVTVMGNVSPAGVLESVSKVKRAEFWPC